MKLTREEKKNSWNEAALDAYIAERNRAAANRIFGDPNAKRRSIPMQERKGFNPHKWGGKSFNAHKW